jgi:hypothetical protein
MHALVGSRAAALAVAISCGSVVAAAQERAAPAASVAAADPPAMGPPRVTPDLARRAVAVALAVAGHPGVRRRLASMAARVRTAAVLPEVWLRAARTTDDALHLAPTVDDPYHYTESGGVAWWLEARLVWHLDRLQFDREEVAVERLRAEREGDAAKLATRVVETLCAWQRARDGAQDPGSSEEDAGRAREAEVEAEIVLDLLTDGWFTAEVRHAGGPAAAPSGKP